MSPYREPARRLVLAERRVVVVHREPSRLAQHAIAAAFALAAVFAAWLVAASWGLP